MRVAKGSPRRRALCAHVTETTITAICHSNQLCTLLCTHCFIYVCEKQLKMDYLFTPLSCQHSSHTLLLPLFSIVHHLQGHSELCLTTVAAARCFGVSSSLPLLSTSAAFFGLLSTYAFSCLRLLTASSCLRKPCISVASLRPVRLSTSTNVTPSLAALRSLLLSSSKNTISVVKQRRSASAKMQVC
jgi:hypothetical protein